MENFDKYALKSGTTLHGNVHEYVITELLAGDSQGFTYRVRTVPPEGRQIRKSKLAEELVIREHFMTLCSERADDGLTVVTPEDIGPTVDDCLDLFTTSSNERARVSKGHKSIIDVIECFAANGTYYYVVDYLNGETLEEYVRQRRPLSIRSALRLLSPIFEATDHIHRFHSLHTDITPRHIRFTSDTPAAPKRPVLFSLYNSIHFSEDGRKPWLVPLTPCAAGYAAPEQYDHLEQFTPQTDVYGLAATLVFCITGNRLPDSRKLDEKTLRDLLPPALPENYVSAIVHALNPEILSRTVSVVDFVDELSADPGDDKGNPSDDSGGDMNGSRVGGFRMAMMIAAALAALCFIIWIASHLF